MNKIITKDVLKRISNEELIEQTKGHAVTIHKYDKRTIELCVNDLLGFDITKSLLVTHTGIKGIELKYVSYLEIF